MSFENHTRGVVFEKQKPSELSAIKCLFRLSISDTLLFAVLLRAYRFYIGFVTNYGLGAIALSCFDKFVFFHALLVCTESFDDNTGSTSGSH